MEIANRLTDNLQFRALPYPLLDALAFAFVEETCADGRELIVLGAPGKTIYLLLEGEIEVTVPSGDSERVIARLGPGALCGLLALIDGAPSSATCRARGTVRVAALSRQAYALLDNAHAPIGYAFRRALGIQLARDFRRLVARLRPGLVRSVPTT